MPAEHKEGTATRYEGPLGVEIGTRLSAVEQAIEHHFAHELQAHLVRAKRQYRDANGIRLDTDRARELSCVWSISTVSRTVCCAAVHNPASAFVNWMYERMVSARPATGIVVFMAGGGGSGKGAAMPEFQTELASEALLIYDTTFANEESALRKVALARSYGRLVSIVFVFRPFEKAVRGVIRRAKDNGRIVPLQVLAHDHAAAPRTVLKVLDTYMDDDQIEAIVINNPGDHPALAGIITEKEDVLNFLANKASYDEHGLLEKGRRVVRDEANKGYVEAYVIAAIERND